MRDESNKCVLILEVRKEDLGRTYILALRFFIVTLTALASSTWLKEGKETTRQSAGVPIPYGNNGTAPGEPEAVHKEASIHLGRRQKEAFQSA